LFVKHDDHIEGLTYLLTLGVRVLTVTEFVLRRALAQAQDTLPGLHPENKRKRTCTPTAERLLHAFAGVSLTIIQSATGEEILRRMTPLAGGQESILQRLGLGTHLYRQLAMQNRGS
jgi:transposase